MSRAVAAEWTRLLSVRATLVCLLGGAVLTAALAPLIGMTTADLMRDEGSAGTIGAVEPAALALQVGQFVLLALAVLAIAAEYGSGSIVSTLLAEPRRTRVLLAKAAVVAPVLAVTGTLLAALGTGLAWPLLEGRGEGSAGEVLARVACCGAGLGLLGLVALGLGALTRSTAGGLTAVFVLFGAIPAVFAAVHTPGLDAVRDWIPSNAALALVVRDDAPYGVPAAIGVLTAWAVAALAAGAVRLDRRDA